MAVLGQPFWQLVGLVTLANWSARSGSRTRSGRAARPTWSRNTSGASVTTSARAPTRRPAQVQGRLAGWLAGRLAGWLLSTGYPLDLEARPVAPVVNSIAAGAGFRSEAGCWCGSYPLDLEARPVVGVKFQRIFLFQKELL